ncbi:hypothetical protein AcW1_006902 [Taiwanofungus camphoratus]|nr:hypothetical protein AcW2_005670 [Antrodia cinnamomea]KAI0947000.1 hypothetical protein AcV7_009556 [Antrodia cinnamomea]KAI0955274.1 hypothetical protein AcW1_006902 [Antrodia cinnamomea]
MTETGGDFILMHHADVHRILYNLAISAGVRVDLNTSVTSIHQGTASLPNPSVTLSTGEVVTADFLLGADGPRSMVRKVVLGREDDAKLSFLTVYTTAIPASEMNKDPELREYLKADEWRIWMGANRSICGHPMSARQAFHLHIYSHTGDQDPPTGNDETWEEVVPLETVAIGTHAPCYLSSVQRLLKMAPFLLRTRMMERPNGVEDWVDETGRIILIGEAAHPWQPGGTHGASIAVEDAVVFGSLFCRLSTWNQVPSFLSAYQELRQARCDAVKQGDISNAKLVAMPPGPAQDARNTDMRMQTTDQWDEGTYKDNFDEMAEIFGYDATDAADEWWVNWGRFSDTTRESPNIKHMSFGFTTTTVETEPHE